MITHSLYYKNLCFSAVSYYKFLSYSIFIQHKMSTNEQQYDEQIRVLPEAPNGKLLRLLQRHGGDVDQVRFKIYSTAREYLSCGGMEVVWCISTYIHQRKKKKLTINF
jgi:hypothetical protein